MSAKAARKPQRESVPSRAGADRTSVDRAGASGAGAPGGRRFWPGEWAITALLWLPPVMLWSMAKDSFRLPKLLFSELFALLALVLLAAFLRFPERIDFGALWRRPVVRASLPLIGAALLGLVFSRHHLYVLDGLWSFAIGMACLLGWSLALPAQRLRRLLGRLLVPAILLAGLGLAQALGWWQPFQFSAGEGVGRLGITSLGGNPGDFGAYLVLPLLLLQASLVAGGAARMPRLRLALVLIAIAGVGAALLGSQSLTAITAGMIGSLVLWGLTLPRRRLVAFGAAGSVLVALLILAVAPVRTRVVGKLAELGRGDFNRVLTGRLDGWRAAVWMFEQSPLVGIGHGAFQAEFGDARLALTTDGVEFFRSQQTPVFGNAHNEYLELAAESGLLGLAALGWGLWLLAGAVRRLMRQGSGASPPQEAVAHRALALAGVTALGLMALTYFPLRIALTGYPWILFLAWLWAAGEESAPIDQGEAA